jgi:hypothetical protein
VEREIAQTKHGTFPDQEASIAKLSNDELIRLRMEDPISAVQSANGVSLTGGHHRVTEIVRRVGTGQLPPDTPVPFLVHD